ncbi:MAG: hypothetical protein LBI03_11480 [Clostridiales bacterium]|nr:hypothetical protein [Clostridiales bacterium]
MKKKFFAIFTTMLLLTGMLSIWSFAADSKPDAYAGAFFISKIRVTYSEDVVVSTTVVKNGGTYVDDKGKTQKKDVTVFSDPIQYLDINFGDYTQIYMMGNPITDKDNKLSTSWYPRANAKDSTGKFVAGIVDGTIIKTKDQIYFSGLGDDMPEDDLGTPNPNLGKDIKVTSISVFLSALGDQQYVSTGDPVDGDPQTQNAITVTIGDTLENINIRKDHKMQQIGTNLGTVNSQTTRSSIDWTSTDADNSFVEKKLDFSSSPLTGKDYIYVNVAAATMQPDAANIPYAMQAHSGTTLYTIPIMTKSVVDVPGPNNNLLSNPWFWVAVGAVVLVIVVVVLIIVLSKGKKGKKDKQSNNKPEGAKAKD